MAKLAVDVASRPPEGRQLAAGNGWSASDIVCSAGPQSPPFEEAHSSISIAIVLAGSFQYRSSRGVAMMTPGALLLGNPGDGFTCGHEHATGDRCLSFRFSDEFRERIGTARFRTARIPPMRGSVSLMAKSVELLADPAAAPLEEFALRLYARAIEAERGGDTLRVHPEASALARVTRVVRMIERDPDVPHDLNSLAGIARLSPYHFLRMFESITGATPHQHVVRMRLRAAAVRLRAERARIAEIALDSGFGDVSNFNRAFRSEFGMSPRVFRSK